MNNVPIESRRGEASRSSHIRGDIEGLRGFAIISVALFHAHIPGFSGGFVGVDVFFVLSGYLITGIIVAKYEVDNFSFLDFYSRRARRLLPAFTIVVIASLAIAAIVVSPIEQKSIFRSAIASAVYLSNIRLARNATDYLAGSGDTDPFLHTWSLSVEEQFYLAWPILIVVAYRLARSRRRLLWFFTAIGAVSFVGNVFVTHNAQPWAFFSMPSRVWQFSAGAIVCLLPSWGKAPSKLQSIFSVSGVALLALAVALLSQDVAYPGFWAVIPTLGTALLLKVGEREQISLIQGVLDNNVMRVAGRLSYSWYLWHWPILVLGAIAFSKLTVFETLLLLAFSLMLANVTYHVVESPLRTSAWLAFKPTRSIWGGIGASAVTVLLCVSWLKFIGLVSESPKFKRFSDASIDLPAIYKNNCVATLFETADRNCVVGDVRSANSIMIFGDSHAGIWVNTLDSLARISKIKLLISLKRECPAPYISYEHTSVNRVYRECDAWRNTIIKKIRRTRPMAVFVSSSYSYSQYGVTSNQWEAGFRSLVKDVKSAGSSLIVIRDVPRFDFNVPICLARAEWARFSKSGASCTSVDTASSRVAVFRTEKMLATENRIPFVDMTSVICPNLRCAPETDSLVIKYYDSNHLTATYARSLTATFLDNLRLAGSSVLD